MSRRSMCLIALMGLLAVPALAHAALAQPWNWLLAPLSGAGEHHIAGRTAWHARLMVLGWGLLLPLGALAARFFKIMPGQDWPRQLDNKAWWHAHRGLQYVGVLAMTFGLGLAWGLGSGRDTPARVHAWLGWSLCIAGWAQVAGGLLRGGKGGPTDVQLIPEWDEMSKDIIGQALPDVLAGKRTAREALASTVSPLESLLRSGGWIGKAAAAGAAKGGRA